MTKAKTTAARTNVVRLTTAALVTALIFLFTFLIKIPTALGYIHLGDAFILLYAAATADPIALLVGALGEGLADVAGGYFQYLPATVIIKALIALPVYLTAKKEREGKSEPSIFSKKIFLSSLPSIVITLGGYFIIDYILGGAYAFAALGTNAVQAVGSIAVFVVLALALDKSDLKHRLKLQ